MVLLIECNLFICLAQVTIQSLFQRRILFEPSVVVFLVGNLGKFFCDAFINLFDFCVTIFLSLPSIFDFCDVSVTLLGTLAL